MTKYVDKFLALSFLQLIYIRVHLYWVNKTIQLKYYSKHPELLNSLSIITLQLTKKYLDR